MKSYWHSLVVIFLMLAQNTWARPHLYSDEEVARRADEIALVRISTSGFTAAPFVLAKVTRRIKGKLPSEVRLPLSTNIECNYKFQPGDWLIFMEKVDGRFVGANCGRAWHPILDGKVSWHRDIARGSKGKEIDLESALKEIESLGSK